MENPPPMDPPADIIVPLAEEVPPGPRTKRARLFTTGSEVFSETSAKMQINLDKNRKGSLQPHRCSPTFQFNMQMALRAVFGVLLASCIQTRDRAYDPANTYVKKWLFFPEWYYLGGLSYCAIMVVFSMGANVGGTLREVCQGISGVGVALVYNYALFAYIHVHRFDSNAPEPYKDYYKIEKAFNGNAYWVYLPDLFTALPWMVGFTVAVLVLPFHCNTRKFALGSNVYFTLTIINPANPLDSTQLKSVGDTLFDTSNILLNLQTYSIVGVLGALISVLTMCLPYPIFAIQRLHQDSKKASDDILGLLNVIVDSYCFKNKSVEHMNFLKLSLRRKFSAAETRHRRMLTLLDEAWWEQCFGLHYLLGFNRVIMRNYVNLVGSLLGDLQTLSCAMRLEQYEELHFTYMKVLQRQIYVIQTRSSDLLNEISREIHASSAHLNLKTMHSLENQVETTLYKYRKLQTRTLRTQTVTIDAMAGNVALNIFLFSLNSFCSTLLNFQQSHNSKRYGDVHRVQSFLLASLKRFVERAHYKHPSTWAGALKGTVALMSGVFLAVYIYGFSATVPSTIAYIMGNHLGGSFQITANRVGGVVAGSVVPSVFKFFFVQACSPEYLSVVLSNLLLFVWVGLSMYVFFARGYSSYGGLVSAFIAADLLLRQSDMCYPNGSDSSKSIAIASYSSLAQTSVAVVIFIAVESLLFPKSAVTLLRHSIQDTLKLHQRAFDVLFGHHLSSSIAMDDETIAEIRHILEVQIPRKLSKQKQLLLETRAEPLMWRPAFSLQKYERVLEISHRLLNNNYMLLKLLRWFHYRVTKNRVKLSPVDIRDDPDGTSVAMDDAGSHQTKWQLASNHFESLVRDNFETMELVFGDSFLYSEPDQMSIFMQMKEAFRLADRDCNGELNSEDVAAMLGTIFAQSGSVKEEEIQQYVQDFMAVVGKAGSDSVSFEQFMEALEHGLKFEVEVSSHRRRSKSLAPPIGDKLSDKAKDAAAVGRPNGSYGSTTEIRRGSLIAGDGNEERGSEGREESDGDASKTSSTSTSQTAMNPNVLRPINPRAGNEELGTSADTSEFCTSMPMRREYDVLNVEDFSITEIVAQMKTAYVEWVLEDKRYEQVSMEEQLLLNCLISGAESIAKNLTDLEEITASS